MKKSNPILEAAKTISKLAENEKNSRNSLLASKSSLLKSNVKDVDRVLKSDVNKTSLLKHDVKNVDRLLKSDVNKTSVLKHDVKNVDRLLKSDINKTSLLKHY